MIADARVIRKLGLGPRPDDHLGQDLESWIDQQLESPPVRLGIRRAKTSSPEIGTWPDNLSYTLEERVRRLVEWRRLSDELDELKLPENERNTRRKKLHDEFGVYHVDQFKFAHANVYSGDHVNMRLATFWLNHFTVGDKETVRQLIQNYFEEAIFSNLGNSFGDMLYSAISHPAMLTYLDNIYSVGDDSQAARDCRGRNDCIAGLNDNLGRELLELHTVSPTRGYTESDIRDAARVLAGWGYIFDKPIWDDAATLRRPYIPYNAEPGDKIVLGKRFGPGPDAFRQLTDFLADDQSTVRHLSGKLALHFIGDSYSEENVIAIENAWIESNGSLRNIHRAVLLEAARSPGRKFLPPAHWLHQLLRMSGAHLFAGFEEVDDEPDTLSREPWKIYPELGHDFWSRRQPDGFSDRKADWVSNEYLDRRYRYADVIFRFGNPALTADEVIGKFDLSETTKELVQGGDSPRTRFILLACSPEFMEV